VAQSGSAGPLYVQASGPLGASGVTLNTKDGDVAKQWYSTFVTSRCGRDV
jgi:hypothetical protein